MRNLKRVLSLALASVMLVGMMAVGTSAAKFTDADKIVNADAVNTLVALSVIAGKDDGSFDPTGIVTRGEMAKMICVALEGGVDPKLAAGSGIFADAATHWAGGYIDYCAGLGILAGDDEGKVNPNAPVKAVEAAKMVLVAIGYSAEREGFVDNATWDTAIAIRAAQKKIYTNVTAAPMDALTRDEAAVLVVNAMKAHTVKYKSNLDTNELGQLTTSYEVIPTVDGDTLFPTINTAAYDYAETTGYAMFAASYDAATETYTYILQKDANTTITFNSTKDYSDCFGMQVMILSEGEIALTRTAGTGGNPDTYAATVDDDAVYGIFAVKSSVVYEGVVGDMALVVGDADAVKIGDKTYTLGANVNTIGAIKLNDGTPYASDLAALIADIDEAQTGVTLIDGTGDGKADIAVVVPFIVDDVTSASTTSITAGANYKFADHTIADGIAKGDIVYIVPADYSLDGKAVITKMEATTGTVTGLKDSGNAALVDGTWYDVSDVTVAIDGEYNFYAVGTKIYFAPAVTADVAASTNLVFVTEWENGTANTNLTGGNAKAYAYFMDGTAEAIEVGAVYTTGNATDPEQDNKYNDIKKDANTNKLYTYSVKDDVYTLTIVDEHNDAGYDSYEGTGSSNKLADDAIVIAQTKDAKKTEIFTGAEVKDWDATAATNFTDDVALSTVVNGIGYVKVVVFSTTTATAFPGAKGDVDNYGYVTSDAYAVKVDGVPYATYTMWNGAEVVTVYDNTSDADEYVAGDIITYTDLGDGYVKESDDAVADTDAYAVVGFDAEELKLMKDDGSAANADLVETTVYMYIDAATKEGIEDGEIIMADMDEEGGYTMNVYVVKDSDGAKFVVVEINNDLLKGNAGKTIPNVTDNTSAAVAVSFGDVTKAVAGQEIEVTFKLAATANTEAEYELTLTGDDSAVAKTSVVFAQGAQANAEMTATIKVPAITTTFTLAVAAK